MEKILIWTLTQNFMKKYFKNLMNKTKINLTKNRSELFLAIISFVLLVIISSCEEEINSLGAELMPNGDKLEVLYDSSFTFKSYVMKNPAINTSNLSTYTLGILDDPYFGTFKGEFAGQFLFEKEDTNIITYTPDSLVLYIAIDTTYGLPLENITFDVYELNSSIDEDSAYYSDAEISNLYNVSDKINTSFEYRGDSLIAFFLTNAFAEKLKSDTSYYASDTAFKSFFKGISIVPSFISSPGGTVNLNFNSDDTKMVFYYVLADDSLSLDYSFVKSGTHRFAKYTYDYTGTPLETSLNNDEQENDNMMFLQGGSGVYSRIQFTNLAPWVADTINYSLLNASLTIPIYSDNNITEFYPPERLMHFYYDEDSTIRQTEDYSNYLYNYNYSFDGKYNSDEKLYHFDISRHLMDVMNGEITDSSINMTIVNQTKYPHRVMLKTGDNIKLKITYTKHTK